MARIPPSGLPEEKLPDVRRDVEAFSPRSTVKAVTGPDADDLAE